MQHCKTGGQEWGKGGTVIEKVYITAHFSWQYPDDCWLVGINHMSEIPFPAPDILTLTTFASLLMSDGMTVRFHPSCILIRLSSRGDSHLLAGTGPQRCQPQSDILWWWRRRFWEQIDGRQGVLYVSTGLLAVTHEPCTHIKVQHEDDAGLGPPLSLRMSLIGSVLSCAPWRVKDGSEKDRILNE